MDWAKINTSQASKAQRRALHKFLGKRSADLIRAMNRDDADRMLKSLVAAAERSTTKPTIDPVVRAILLDGVEEKKDFPRSE